MTFDLASWVAAAPSAPPIVQAGDWVLRRRAAEVAPSLLGSSTLRRLVEVMTEVMRGAPGVGLAAPQIGVPLRVFVAEDDATRLAKVSEEARVARRRVVLPLLAIVNPTVTPISADQATFFEGCLSVRGYGALVSRAAVVRVTGLDVEGQPITADLEGWPARIMQHEMDHLNGTLYVDRMISRSFAADTHLPELAGMPANELLSELDAGHE
jgi:peptide deformylase